MRRSIGIDCDLTEGVCSAIAVFLPRCDRGSIARVLPCRVTSAYLGHPHNPSRTHATSDIVATQFRQLVAACMLTSHLCTNTYAHAMGSYWVATRVTELD
jgi:hypothetical protein